MRRTHASRVLMAMAVGGIAGMAFVFNDDWFTRFIGGILGCACMLVAYVGCDFFAAWFKRGSLSGLSRAQIYRDEYDQNAYRIERIFMDDGKPW